MTGLVSLCFLVVLTPYALAQDPYAPPPEEDPSPTDQMCFPSVFGSVQYMSGGEYRTFISGDNKNCASYYCDGTGAPAENIASLSCGNDCVDGASTQNNECACVACPAGAGGVENLCEPDPCQNGGTCVPDTVNNMATCDCPPGYSGMSCEFSPCEPSPCENGGTCTSDSTMAAGYRCDCAPGYLDNNCQTPACSSNPPPCVYGTCSMDPSNPDGYLCTCQSGYTGTNCDTQECVDTYEPQWHCGYWQEQGYCNPTSEYYPFMGANCKATCGFC